MRALRHSTESTQPAEPLAPVAAPSLFIAARTIADCLHHGRHPSNRRGASTEFYDFRPYVPGDPLRLLDWRALARSDRAYLRRFHHESQLTVTVALDASASMDFTALGGAEQAGLVSKFRRAQELAATIALATIRQGDRAGLIVSSSRESRGTSVEIPPSAGQGAFRRAIDALERAAPEAASGEGPGQSLLEAIDRAGAMTPRGGLVVVISDALDEAGPMLDALSRVRSGHGRTRDVALIQVLTPDELDIAGSGAARLVDPETGISVSARGTECAAAYAAAIGRHIEALRSGVERLQGRYALCMTHRAPLDALRQALAR